MSDEKPKIQPFDSFSKVYKILVWAGYYKLLNKPKNRYKWVCHQIYRPFAVMVAIGYNIMHIIYIIQNRHNLDDVFDCSIIELPQINMVVKILTLNFHATRIDKINKLLNGPMFTAYTKKDEEMMLKTQRNMHRLSNIMNMSVTAAVILWSASYFIKRYQDPTAVVTYYVPFETNTWTRFSYSVLMEVIPMLWVAYGHLSADCVIATYYAQAEVQLKIIKHNLEHLFDTDSAYGIHGDNWVYRDDVDNDLKNRFVHYVRRYEAVGWYTKEVTDVFNSCMSFQLLSSTALMCVITYRMSSASVVSVQFIFLSVLLFIISTQVVMYCYFGNLVKDESDSLITSVYLSEWLSVSPRFRRLLLIAMLRWSRPLTPQVFGIVPLSLETFVSIMRGAYSLYAVLITKE